MASPLRRSTRRNADPSATTPEPTTLSPSVSPTKADRKRKRVDEPVDTSNELDGAAETVADDAAKQSPTDATKPDGTADGVTSESAEPTKTQLPKNLQALLGLPGFSTALRPSTSPDLDAAAQKAKDLVLSEEDAVKLSTIIEALDTANLLPAAHGSIKKGKASSGNGTAPIAKQLEDVVRAGTDLLQLKTRLLRIREPLLAQPDIAQHLQAGSSSIPSQATSTDVAKLSSLTLVLGLVDQLASRQRQTDLSTESLKGQLLASSVERRAESLEARVARKMNAADATDDDDEAESIKVRPVSLSTDEETTSRYALHMRLPRGDYFTKAIALDRDQLSKLDAAQADIVQISAQSEAQLRTLKRQGLVPTPTLGQRLGRSAPRHRDSKKSASQQPGRPQPVTFLNYGNYASFAPTCDSASASISYATSSTLFRNSVKAQRAVSLAWGNKPFLSYEGTEEDEDDIDADEPSAVEPPYADGSIGKGDTDVDEDVDMSEAFSDEVAAALRSLVDGKGSKDISASLDKLNQDELVTDHLRFNMMLLHRLQEFQWARLRRSYTPTARGRRSAPAIEDESPSAEEEATAALLLESLSALVALQPRAADLTSDAVQSVVPEVSKLRAFSASSGAIDPDLVGDVRDSFWGALDANIVKVSKTGTVSAETPLVLRDDTTIRLADGSGSKAKKSARRTGPAAGQLEDRGHGVLERFAASRTYDHQQDRHDVEPVRAAAGGEQPGLLQRTASGARGNMPSTASPQQRQAAVAMSPNARMHGGLPGQGAPMTPQQQRLAPGPNASYAFASPAVGLSYAGRPMPSNATAPYSPHSGGHMMTPQGQPARQS